MKIIFSKIENISLIKHLKISLIENCWVFFLLLLLLYKSRNYRSLVANLSFAKDGVGNVLYYTACHNWGNSTRLNFNFPPRSMDRAWVCSKKECSRTFRHCFTHAHPLLSPAHTGGLQPQPSFSPEHAIPAKTSFVSSHPTKKRFLEICR